MHHITNEHIPTATKVKKTREMNTSTATMIQILTIVGVSSHVSGAELSMIEAETYSTSTSLGKE